MIFRLINLSRGWHKPLRSVAVTRCSSKRHARSRCRYGGFLYVTLWDSQFIADVTYDYSSLTGLRGGLKKQKPSFVSEKMTSCDNTLIPINETPSLKNAPERQWQCHKKSAREYKKSEGTRDRQTRLSDRWMCIVDSPALYCETTKALLKFQAKDSPFQPVRNRVSSRACISRWYRRRESWYSASLKLCTFFSRFQILVQCFVGTGLLYIHFETLWRLTVLQEPFFVWLKTDRTVKLF